MALTAGGKAGLEVAASRPDVSRWRHAYHSWRRSPWRRRRRPAAAHFDGHARQRCGRACRRLKTSLGAARAARTAARGHAALPPRSRHGLRPGRPRGWRGSDHSTWFGASGGLLGIFGSAAPARASDPVSPAGEVCGVQPRGVADYVAWCACASVVIATRTVSALPVPAGSVATHALSLWVESWFMRESWCARII